MGLAERRALKAFQENQFVAFQTNINEIVGDGVTIDIDWDTLALEDYAHLYEEGFSKTYFTPLVEALKAIAIDDMGKEALKLSFKKIIIKNTGEIYSPSSAYTFSDGVLSIDHQPFTNIDNITEKKDTLQRMLEKGL